MNPFVLILSAALRTKSLVEAYHEISGLRRANAFYTIMPGRLSINILIRNMNRISRIEGEGRADSGRGVAGEIVRLER